MVNSITKSIMRMVNTGIRSRPTHLWCSHHRSDCTVSVHHRAVFTGGQPMDD